LAKKPGSKNLKLSILTVESFFYSLYNRNIAIYKLRIMGVSKRHLHSIQVNQLADLAKVLSHPARISILNYIGDCDGCLCKDISEKIRLSQPTTSQHLQVIKKSGLLKSKFEGKSQYYTINKDKLMALKELFAEFFQTTEQKCC
jgi:DNA-binding transcriptional ArsR family regulator